MFTGEFDVVEVEDILPLVDGVQYQQVFVSRVANVLDKLIVLWDAGLCQGGSTSRTAQSLSP